MSTPSYFWELSIENGKIGSPCPTNWFLVVPSRGGVAHHARIFEYLCGCRFLLASLLIGALSALILSIG